MSDHEILPPTIERMCDDWLPIGEDRTRENLLRHIKAADPALNNTSKFHERYDHWQDCWSVHPACALAEYYRLNQ